MSDQSAGGFVAKAIGFVISGAIAAVPWLTAGWSGIIGSVLTIGLTALCVIGGPASFLVYRRYLGILAASEKPRGSLLRQAYLTLRDTLLGGNLAARLYRSLLTCLLDRLDRYLADADTTTTAWFFPQWLRLKTPKPLWTSAAFDRCLLLALIYPVATVFILWAIAGHVGPAEAALGLKSGIGGEQRAIAAFMVSLLAVFMWCTMRARGKWLEFVVWFIVTAILAAFVALAEFGPGVDAGGVAVAGALLFAGFGPVAGAFAVVISIFVGCAGAIGGARAAAGAALATAAIAISLSKFVGVSSRSRRVFLIIFFIVMLSTCLAAAYLLSAQKDWVIVGGPFLLFLGLLTLINAPFDWISLGLTRALLRRGLELEGWSPFFLALADAILAAAIVAALALAMVIGVQAFDGLAVHGGGRPVLPLDALFDGIAAHPEAPEYWWIYALLLSTVIPSLINLMIGGASLMRGLPWVPSKILRFMPAASAVLPFDRAWIALVLTIQSVGGAILGVIAQSLLIVGVIGYVMPQLGLGLLDKARDLAAFNLPLRIGQFFISIF